jgi:hypothetical protein
MTERELAICCAILERRGLRYCPQPGSRDSQAGVTLWFVTPTGIRIEAHAGSMWGLWTFLKLGQDRVGGARQQHQFALMEQELEQALRDERHGAGPEDFISGELVTTYSPDAEDLARELIRAVERYKVLSWWMRHTMDEEFIEQALQLVRDRYGIGLIDEDVTALLGGEIQASDPELQ